MHQRPELDLSHGAEEVYFKDGKCGYCGTYFKVRLAKGEMAPNAIQRVPSEGTAGPFFCPRCGLPKVFHIFGGTDWNNQWGQPEHEAVAEALKGVTQC